MITTAKIIGYDGQALTVVPVDSIVHELLAHQADFIEIRINDGRSISNEQRRKIFALIRDISDWCGHYPEEIRQILTWNFRSEHAVDDFSLSTVDMTTARKFIGWLIEFCFKYDVPCRDRMIDRTDDISNYLYLCLKHRRCAICGKKAEVHHVDKVGMGRDREHIVHVGLSAVALCREHHTVCHTNEKQFLEQHHIYGIKLTDELCQILKLNTEENKHA